MHHYAPSTAIDDTKPGKYDTPQWGIKTHIFTKDKIHCYIL